MSSQRNHRLILSLASSSVSLSQQQAGRHSYFPSRNYTEDRGARRWSRTLVEKGKDQMNILTFSEARAGLKAVMDDVCTDHSPTIITRQSGEAVVMLSLADFNSIEETLYLLGSPKNANRLLESMEQLKAGKARKRELIRHEKQEGKQQRTS